MPCGTPETTSIRLDCLPSTMTLCFLFFYKIINPKPNFLIYVVVLEFTKETIMRYRVKSFEKFKTAMPFLLCI